MFQLLDSSRSDWWLVALPNSSQSGWVPADYLEKRVMDNGRPTSPTPEPFHDETGEIERVIKRCVHVQCTCRYMYVDRSQ